MVLALSENWSHASIFICMYEFTKVMFSIVDYCTVGMIPLNASNDW